MSCVILVPKFIWTFRPFVKCTRVESLLKLVRSFLNVVRAIHAYVGFVHIRMIECSPMSRIMNTDALVWRGKEGLLPGIFASVREYKRALLYLFSPPETPVHQGMSASSNMVVRCTLLFRANGLRRNAFRTPPVIFPTAKHIITTQNQTSNTSCCHKKDTPPAPPPPSTLAFWTDRPTVNRASINTLRCLVGCTIGDFGALFYLQSAFPHLPPHITMPISMAAGILSSITLETFLLYRGKDRMSLGKAFQTACGMSLISMIAMEAAENGVDYHLTGGMVDLGSVTFWGSAVVAVGAGFLAALPYNYWRLRKFGKACH